MRNTSLALFVYGAVVVVCRIAFARLPGPGAVAGRSRAVTLVVMAAGLLVMAAWQHARRTPGRHGGDGGRRHLRDAGVLRRHVRDREALRDGARPPATASISLDLGLGLGPILLGLVANAYGIPWAFVVAAVPPRSPGRCGPCT